MMILSVSVMIAITITARIVGRSWLFPGAFFAGYWTIMVLLSVVGAPDYETPWIGPAWIGLACAVFLAGCCVGDLRRPDSVSVSARIEPDPPLPNLPWVITICTALGMVYFVARLIMLGPVWNFDENAPDMPEPFQALLACFYAGPAFGGLLFARGGRKARLIGLAAFIPAALSAVVYVRRSWLLMSGMFWLGGLFTAWIRDHHHEIRIITLKRVVISGVIVVTLAGLAIVFQLFRMQINGTETTIIEKALSYSRAYGSGDFDEAWTRVRVIIFGYIVPFSHWLSREWDQPSEMSLGTWTFAGPARVLGLGERTRIDEFELQSGALSNLYTAFYGLILDFSPIGALVIMFGFGWISGRAFRAVTSGSMLAIPVLIGFFATTIFSPLWSLFRYNALIGALVYLGMYAVYSSTTRHKTIPTPGQRLVSNPGASAKPTSTSSRVDLLRRGR